MIKKDFRKDMINIRKYKDPKFINDNSLIISDKLLSFDCISNSKNIMFYLDFNNEVKTDYLIKRLIYMKKYVSSQVTIINDKKFIPYLINNKYNLK